MYNVDAQTFQYLTFGSFTSLLLIELEINIFEKGSMSVPLEFDFCRIFLRYFSLLTVESHPGESSNTRSCFM